jgi:hypothetical protein
VIYYFRILFSQDYQEFNAIRLSELETLYQTKLETIRNEFLKHNEQQETTSKPREVRVAIDSTKKEHRSLIEQNQLLKDKLGKFHLLNLFSRQKQILF